MKRYLFTFFLILLIPFLAFGDTYLGGSGGSGDVTAVGDCTGGACLDGTSDGGTQILFYDAQGATTLVGGDTSGAVTLTLPTTTGTLLTSAGTAAVATAVTLTDNESTNENNPIWFSAGAAGSGSVGAEADGDLYYNPSSGTLTVPTLSATTGINTPDSETPGMEFNDSDDAAGTFTLFANSSGGANDIVASYGVEDSGGENQSYIELDGVAEDVEIKKPLVVEDDAVFAKLLANTPQRITYNADDDSETVGTDITSSTVFITTDNDATDETVDIQDGTVDGQMVTFVCVSGCDGTDDGVNIDVETDSTCTGCESAGVFPLGSNGDSVTIVWDNTASAWYEVGSYLQ